MTPTSTSRKGKTESSVRYAPIHPQIKSLVKRLKDNSEDGFLIPNLKRGGDGDKRYQHAGKERFGRFIRQKASIKDTGVVFHSLRNTFSTALENAGVPESTAQQIIGHATQSMTYGFYSRGADLERLG